MYGMHSLNSCVVQRAREYGRVSGSKAFEDVSGYVSMRQVDEMVKPYKKCVFICIYVGRCKRVGWWLYTFVNTIGFFDVD